MNTRRVILRLLSVLIASAILSLVATTVFAQEGDEIIVMTETALTAETVQTNLNQIWLLMAGFLIFFMQAGFAMLEGGFIRATGVVNSLAENFMDACITGIVFFIVGYGIAYADPAGGAIFSMPELALGGITGTAAGDGLKFIDFFFQFAFAGAAATIATGAMAERTNFMGKLIYSAIIGAFIYPVVVFWTWGGGWLAQAGFLDFAGSTIVHQTGGFIALAGALMVGPRVGRVFGNPPRPSNMALAALGTFILWFGWYGFNVGSTLEATNPDALGLVAINTTLAACAGALAAMAFQYTRSGHWDLAYILNGSLAGLVGITAGCAFVAPAASIIIGLLAGVIVVVAMHFVEMANIDDAVGAFAVHGVCGMWGTLAIGVFGLPSLTENAGGLLAGGGFNLLIIQAVGVLAVALFAGGSSFAMFSALKAFGLLRMHGEAEAVGIDVYEHGASVWPDVLPIDDEIPAPAAGD